MYHGLYSRYYTDALEIFFYKIDLFEGSQRIWISLFINSVAKLAGSFWLLIVGLCIAKGGKFDRQNNILDGLCVCEQMWHSTLFQLFIHVSTTR